MRPTDELKHEHQTILGVLAAARREAERSLETGKADYEFLAKALDFFRGFADRCHHAKEERHLFQAMEKRGFPRSTGPLAIMRHEHNEGRARVRAAAEALPAAARGDAAAVQSLAKNLLAYVDLLEAHIGKEDNILYPMADRMLTEQDQKDLQAAFARVEREEMGETVHEDFRRLARELGAMASKGQRISLSS